MSDTTKSEHDRGNAGNRDGSVCRAIADIASGNDGFVHDHESDYFSDHVSSQTPFITMVTCSDSRVQATALLPDPVNNIFTIKNIGNQLETCQGSVDYGVLHLETPVLLILGHADCGAIKAFMGGYQDEPLSIRKELDSLEEGFAVHRKKLHRKDMEREDDWDLERDVPTAVQINVDHQVSVALERYHKLVRDGKLTVVGAFYDFRNEAGKGHGRIVVLNVNGETDGETLENLPIIREVRRDVECCATGRLQRR